MHAIPTTEDLTIREVEIKAAFLKFADTYPQYKHPRFDLKHTRMIVANSDIFGKGGRKYDMWLEKGQYTLAFHKPEVRKYIGSNKYEMFQTLFIVKHSIGKPDDCGFYLADYDRINEVKDFSDF